MKKFTLIVTFLVVVCLNGFSNPVNRNTAALVAKNLFLERADFTVNPSATIPQLVYTESSGTTDYYYIFNLVSQKQGFVIVSADDDAYPVLGYSFEGIYTGENLPDAFTEVLGNYKDQIAFIKSNHLKADVVIQSEWNRLSANSISPKRGLLAAGPLLTTTWDQNRYYNDLCPSDGAGPGGHVYAGCVATAMGQVMKYFNHPASGSGSHSYYHVDYGNLSANFGMTTYNWASMPNSISSANSSIATLLLHCGISVEMNYGPSGSGAYTEDVANSLITYFDYKNTASFKYKSSYTTADWELLLKTEIDNNRPMVYKGSGSSGGHAFVCDGYQGTSNDHFHFNWGWSGYYNGYFYVTSLNPGSYNFTSSQGAVMGIQPNATTSQYDLRLYGGPMTITPDPMVKNQSVTVHLDIANYGTTSFSGNYSVSLFDMSGNYVTDIEEITGATLGASMHYTNGVDFTNASLSVPTGNYLVAAFYQPTGGSWTLLGEGNYTNPVTSSVVSGGTTPSGIALYSPIKSIPDTLIQGQPVIVYMDIANYSTTTAFYGDFAAVVHNISGAVLDIIDTFHNVTLGTLKYFDSVVFKNTTLNLTAGEYLVSLQHKPSGGSWAISDPGNYVNPIHLVVIPPPLTPDGYESNNIETNAYNFPVSFSGDNASVSTSGSNLHLDTDADYYKIILPAGADYTIKSRVHDSRNSGNGNSYTCDVMFSYKPDVVWSTTFNDIEAPDINISNGGSIIFKVEHYYTGKGTYLLDIQITRTLLLPDLIILNENVTPLTVKKGEAISASCNIKNQNPTAASSSTIKFYLSEDVLYQSLFDVELGSSNSGSMVGNGTAPISKNMLIPSTTNTGTFYILFIADANKEITESNENNNMAYQQISVIPNTGISENTQESIVIYPNPTSGLIRIGHDFDQLILTDLQGKIVFQTIYQGSKDVDISALPAGIYMAKIISKTETIYSKILIRK